MTKKRLIINSFTSSVFFITNVIITFLLSPVVVRQLGNRDYGIWDLLLSLCGYLGLLEVGIGPAMIRYIAKADALEDKKEIQKIFVNAFFSLSLIGLVAFVIMSSIAWHPEGLFNVTFTEFPYLSWICLLAGLNFVIQLPGTVFVTYLMGLQKHFLVNYVRLVLLILSSIFTYWSLIKAKGTGLLWLSVILLVANFSQYLFFFLWIKKRVGLFRWTERLFSWETSKALYLYGGKSFLFMLADRIQRLSIPFVIGHTLGVSTIVFYSIPARLFEFAGNFINTIGFPLTAFFSAIEAKNGIEKIRTSWLATNRYLQILVLGLAVGLGVLGYDFIGLWMGYPYAEGGKWVILCLSISLFITGLAANSNSLLIGLDQHGRPALFLVLISILTFMMCLISASSLGLAGIACSVMIGNMAGSLYCWRKTCTFLEISLSKNLRNDMKSLGGPILIFFLVLMALSKTNHSGSFIGLFLTGGVGLIIYFISVFLLTLKPEERRKFKEGIYDRWTHLLGKDLT